MKTTQLRERKFQIGTWLSLGSAVVGEMAAECGFDWLLLDLEHGCGSEAGLLSQLQALRGSGVAAIVRVGAPYPDLIARALDWGADGIMVPHVSSVGEARDCVRAMRYPPIGRRGYSRSVRAYGYGLRPPKGGDVSAPLFFAQIETIDAVENSQAIAEVDGVDVLFVGPADLQFDLNVRPAEAKRDYRGCLEHVSAAANAAGKPCGLLVRDMAEIDAQKALGFTHLAIDSDLAILRRGYQSILSATRAGDGR